MASNSTITSTTDSSAISSSAAESSSLASAISSSIASVISSSIITQPDSTTTVEPGSTSYFTSTETHSSEAPTTAVITSVVTQSATSNGQTNTNPITVVVTSVNDPSTTNVQTVPASTPASSASATSSAPAAISNSSGGSGGNGGSGSGGLGTAGKTAIAVVIPVAFVALLVGLGIWFWRKRKQGKDDREQRRKEIDEYGYNPNNDPTLPAVGSEAGGPQMAEDSNAGYRGWGAATGSNRKASTTLSGGHTQGQLSESGNSYGHSPGSPGDGTGAYSDGHSVDPLVNQRDTMGSDELGALGAAPAATGNNQGIRRGPSNASSAYSAGGHSEASDEPVPPMPSQYDVNPASSYGYNQHGPYGDGSYGGGQDANGMPVVRDVSARRNTRIQQGGQYQQGNSGIAQNF